MSFKSIQLESLRLQENQIHQRLEKKNRITPRKFEKDTLRKSRVPIQIRELRIPILHSEVSTESAPKTSRSLQSDLPMPKLRRTQSAELRKAFIILDSQKKF